MGSLSKIIKEKGGELGKARTEQIKVQQIHYTKLKESDLNFILEVRRKWRSLQTQCL